METKELLKKAEKLYSAVIADCLDTAGYRNQCPDPGIRPINRDSILMGRVATLLTTDVFEIPENPYEMEIMAIDALQTDEVLMVQCSAVQPSALWGGLITNGALGRGARGVVVDGYSRDCREILALNFPVFCRGFTPLDSKGRQEGILHNVPIQVGGVLVKPGDFVYGDIDGIVVVPSEVEDKVITAAWEKVQGEDKVRDELRTGVSVKDVFEKYGIL